MTHEAPTVLDSLGMSQADLAELRSAVEALERPSLAARLANMAGKPIELIEHALPATASQTITGAVSKALEVALQVALRSMQRRALPESQRLHKALATAFGALAGTTLSCSVLVPVAGMALALAAVVLAERQRVIRSGRMRYRRLAQAHRLLAGSRVNRAV